MNTPRIKMHPRAECGCDFGGGDNREETVVKVGQNTTIVTTDVVLPFSDSAKL